MGTEEELTYNPDMIPEDGDSLYCFLDHGRPCGRDCIAFLTFKADMRKTELDDNQRHCLLLVSADRLARHAVILVSRLAESEKKRRTAAQDRQREANTPKPPPFVGPTSPFPVEKKP